MSTKIGVAIRVRPLLEHEKKLSMQTSKLQVLPNEKEIRIQNEDMRGYKSFKFDKVLDQETDQEDLFHQTQIQDLVNKVVEGYHSTIFAYGQTGSGKTYTMEGYKYEMDPTNSDLSALANPFSRDAGIIPRSINTLFESIKSYSKLYRRSYTVYCSYLQIYNEKIYDLLNPTQMINANSNKPGAGLRLRWTQKDQFAVENLFVFECRNAEEVLALFHQGLRNKIMASHKLNVASSRSHCMLSLRVDSFDPRNPDNIITSKLDLVDLAGSERTSQTGNETLVAQKESIEINKSLFTLRQVIATLADLQKSPTEKNKEKIHIPYRDSKLTCLLKQSIGGNCYCLMIACLAPADRFFEENLSTLTYATKAAYISNEPTRNDDPKTRLISDLKVQVNNLSKELEKANTHINFLSQLTSEKFANFAVDTGPNERKTPNAIRETSSRASRNEGQGRVSMSRTSEKRVVPPKEMLVKRKTTNFGEETGLKFNRQESITPPDKIDKVSALDDNLTPEMMNERLIESINTVKDLLKSNKEVREKMDKLVGFNETLHGELSQLMRENQDLREKLIVYESLFNNGGNAQNLSQEGVPLAEGKIDYNAPLNGSPRSKKSSNVVQDLTEEVLNLRRHKKFLEDKVRDTEIENITLHQKFYPASHLIRGRKTSTGDDSFQAHQYYQSLISKPRQGQKYGADANSDIASVGYSRAGTASTPPKEEFTKQAEKLNRTDFGSFNDHKRMSSPEINSKLKHKDSRHPNYYLPQLGDRTQEVDAEPAINATVDLSAQEMKKTNNTLFSWFIKKRANSTLKKIRNDERPVNRTISEMHRVQMPLTRAEEV